MTIEVTCSKCKGTGKRRLSRHLMETLNHVSIVGEATAEDIAARLPDDIGTTAVNNRLEDLREMGLLKRRRDKRFWVYSCAEIDYVVTA